MGLIGLWMAATSRVEYVFAASCFSDLVAMVESVSARMIVSGYTINRYQIC